MKIQLPLSFENKYFEEFWSFERFLIINTVPKYQKLQYLNYNTITNNNDSEIIYGYNGKIYDQHSIYNELLSIKGFLFSEISEKEIINFIKKSIQNNNYILINLFNISKEDVHEILIFGYDDNEQIFFYPIVSKGIVKIEKVKFKNLLESYKIILKKYNDFIEKYAYKFPFCYPISKIKIKKNKKIKNLDWLSFYLFLIDTLTNCFTYGEFYYDNIKTKKYYNGLLGMYNLFFDEFKKYLNGITNYDFPLNLKRFIKYRKFVYDLFIEYFNILKINYDLYQFKNNFKILDNVLLLLIKYKSYKKEFIFKICDKLIFVYNNDLKVIENLLNISKKVIYKI